MKCDKEPSPVTLENRPLTHLEGNIDKTLANRFKKRGMRWSIPGALSLAKVGEKIVNNEWDSWWFKETDQIRQSYNKFHR